MLAVALSILFGITAFAAFAVIAHSGRTALLQARAIRLELKVLRLFGDTETSRPAARPRAKALPPLFARA